MFAWLAIHGFFYTYLIACFDNRQLRHLCTLLMLQVSHQTPTRVPAATTRRVAKMRDKIVGLSEAEKAKQYALVVEDLTKWYFETCKLTPHHAVNGLTFGVRPGQCFGLIGRTSAGKTALFRVLTGEDTATFGRAIVAGEVVTDGIGNVSPTATFV